MKECFKDRNVVAMLAAAVALYGLNIAIPKTGDGGPNHEVYPPVPPTENAFTQKHVTYAKLEDGVATYTTDMGDGTFRVSKYFCGGDQNAQLVSIIHGEIIYYSSGIGYAAGESTQHDVCANGTIDEDDGWVHVEGLRLFTVANDQIDDRY